MPHAWDESLRLRTTPYNTASPSLLSENWKFTAASRSFNAGASLSGEGTFSRSNRFYKQEPTTGKMLTLPSTFSRAMKRPKTGVGSFGAVSRLVQAGPRQESSWNTNLEVIPGPQARYEPNQCVSGTFAYLTRKSKKLEIETAKSNLHSLRRRRKVLLNKVGGGSKHEKEIRSLTKRINLLHKREKVIRKNARPGTVPVSLRNRFADMNAKIRESSAIPGPGEYNYMKNKWQENMHRAPKMGASDRLVPAFHYRMLYKESILLGRDDSYDSVGPGQFTPTLAPARTGTIGPSASVHVMNPRSLEKITFAEDASRISPTKNRSKMQSQESLMDMSATWWDDGLRETRSLSRISRRSTPYAMYGGGLNLREVVAERAPAFQEPRSHVFKGETLEDYPFEFGPAVTAPLKKQRRGPKHLPMRMHLKSQARQRNKSLHESRVLEDIDKVMNLPVIRIEDDD